MLAMAAIEPSSGGVLAFTYMYLFLSMLLAYNLYSTLSDLIAIFKCILLGCLLSYRCGNFLNRLIMLFLLILRMLLILLSITVNFYIWFGNTNLTVEGFGI